MDNKIVYETLRQEILDMYHRQINLVTFTFTATAAILSFGFTAKNPMIFLLPIVILWLSLMQLSNSMYSVFTISIYIRKSIEGTTDVAKWEQDISSLRTYLRERRPISALRYFNPIISFDVYHYAKAIIVMGIACIGLCVWYATFWPDLKDNEIVMSYLASFFGAIFWATRSIKLFEPIAFINSGKFEKELPGVWNDAKQYLAKLGKEGVS
jgi:hypothetical protein